MGGEQSRTSPLAQSEKSTAIKFINTHNTNHSQDDAVPLTPGHPEKIRSIARFLSAENQKKKRKEEHEVTNTKENLNIVKQLFKKMDPSVLRTSSFLDHGDLHMSFKYDLASANLLVKVISCRDLDPKDLRGQSADPYVKLFLHSDAQTSGVSRTATIKNTLNPTFNEIFSFEVSEESLLGSHLVTQVWDYDVLDKDDFIGEVIVPLSGLDLLQQGIHTVWYTLKSETNLSLSGNLEVSLKFKMPESLFVTVHTGSNMTNQYEDDFPKPVVKVQIPGIETLYETQVQRSTVNPVWEETFEFSIPVEEFSSRYVVLHAIDQDGSGENESLGQIIIELNNLDIDAGFRGSFQLTDMRNNDRLRAQWFQHATLQEFREALVAHAAFRQPKFLFQRHSGTKMVRVVNKKAKSEARLRIVNGIPVF